MKYRRSSISSGAYYRKTGENWDQLKRIHESLCHSTNKSKKSMANEEASIERRHESKIPRFDKGESPEQWVRMFEDTTHFASKWTDQLKLKLVPSYLHKKARKWFYNQDFATWKEFKEEFKTRFEDKRKIKGATDKFRDVQCKKLELLEDLIDRLDDLKRRHLREVDEYDELVTKLHEREL